MEEDSDDVQVGAVSKGKEPVLLDIQEDSDDELMNDDDDDLMEDDDDLMDDDDDYLYDDDSGILESQFDDMDNIPTGVETAFPWLSTSTNQSSEQQSDGINPTNSSYMPHSSALLGSMDKTPYYGAGAPNPYLQSSGVSLLSKPEPPFLGSRDKQGTLKPTIDEVKKPGKLLESIELFKKFDTVEDCSDHFYLKNYSETQRPKKWAKRIQEEWRILEKDLPEKQIFVRVYESRMDLLRAAIIGAEGTPYHNGLFFFDVFFPSSYPDVPPIVHYHSGGLRINPNLYKCGKVCLSLLNTWPGDPKEKWIPGVSTMLQVLVSIQALILNADPYFNEPGYESSKGSADGKKRCFDYNENTFMHSLQTMVYSVRRPPKYFEDLVVTHFGHRGRDILSECRACLEGWKVGWLVEGEQYCRSRDFKRKLSTIVSLLVNLFTTLGAKHCDEFICLPEKWR